MRLDLRPLLVLNQNTFAFMARPPIRLTKPLNLNMVNQVTLIRLTKNEDRDGPEVWWRPDSG